MGRCIGFRNSGYLVLNENEIDVFALIDWFTNHVNDYVYVKSESGKIKGIIDGKKFDIAIKKFLSDVSIEEEYISIENVEEDNRLYIYDIFDTNLKINHLPVIKNGVLLGEYYDTFQTKENVERYHIRSMIPELIAFVDDIKSYFKDNNIRRVQAIVDSDDEYTKLILSKIDNVSWNFCLSYNDLIDYGKDTLNVDLKYPTEYREFLNKLHVPVITLFQMVGKILLKRFASYCRTNEINLLAVYAVGKKDISYLSVRDMGVMNTDLLLNDMLGDITYLNKFYRKNKSIRYATSEEVGPLGSRTIRHNGIYNHLMDCKNEFINVKKGVRRTTNQPANWKQEIHMFGPCIVQGICVTDEYTIESYLQRKLNRKCKNHYKVFNHGAASHTPDSSFCNDILVAMDTCLHKGDTVIFLDAFSDSAFEWLADEDIQVIKDIHMFDGTANYFMNNTYHCNHLANQKYASLIFPYISIRNDCDVENHKYFEEKNIDLDFRDDAFLHNPELRRYSDEVAERFGVKKAEQKKIAAICTQANPFTKGHYYLVEKAAREMDYVYVFVVQDSLNALPFLDRMQIVKNAVKDLENVFVVSCGTFMSSFRTFPDYFTVAKYENGFDLVNVITDTKIFASIFCKKLNIKYRYLGEEPNDVYTQQLNEHFFEVLPQYGVTPVLVKRASYGEKPISASAVRRMIEDKQYEEVKNYIHDYTLKVLINYYEHQRR